MKKFFTENIGLKILAAVLAIVVWVIAVNFSNPEITATKQVEIEVRNSDIFENAGKTFELLSDTTVNIEYKVRTRDAYKIKASDFIAYIDMNDLYEVTGSVPIMVDVVNNENLILEANAKPSVMRVNVEDVVKLNKEVIYELDGEPQDGYTVGSVELNPSSITVSGPSSIVTQIKDVKIVIDVNGINEDLEGSATPVFIDSIGRTVDVSAANIHVNHSTVSYYVTTLVGKTVPVQYNVSGTPADGYSFSGVEASINQVVIRGSKATLAEVNSIVVPKENLNVDGLSENKEVVIDLSRFLPSGLEIVGDPNSVVTLKIEGQETKHFTISSDQFAIVNPVEGFEYLIEPITTDVELAGLKEDLDVLDPKDILASIDVSGIEEEGTYSVEPQFTLPSGYVVKSHGDITVTATEVPIEERESAEAVEGENEGEAAESENESEEITETTAETAVEKTAETETKTSAEKETVEETKATAETKAEKETNE